MLKGKDILLRSVESSDNKILFEWENDTENWQVSSTLLPFTQKAIDDFCASEFDIFSHKQFRFMIQKNSTKEVIGCLDLFEYDPLNQRAGVGVLIGDKSQRGKGYAHQAIEVLLKYAKNTLRLHQLWCTIPAGHIASVKLFEKNGFTCNGTKKQWLNRAEGWEDELIFQRLL